MYRKNLKLWTEALSKALIERGVKPREAVAQVRTLMTHYLGCDLQDEFLERSLLLTKDQMHAIEDGVERLKEDEPVQYITGVTHFCDLVFKVTPGTLIPRPETEELVELIQDHLPQDQAAARLRILDFCTGSGCIAITLQKRYPNAYVQGEDSSAEALTIAQSNAEQLDAPVQFYKRDLFSKVAGQRGQWDLMISNPPYVPQSLYKQLHPRISYEPPSAISVSDEEPLCFYKRILELASTQVKTGGWIALELHAPLSRETHTLFAHSGAWKLALKKDFRGHPRFLFGQKIHTIAQHD